MKYKTIQKKTFGFKDIYKFCDEETDKFHKI